jgi:hypothetical protein
VRSRDLADAGCALLPVSGIWPLHSAKPGSGRCAATGTLSTTIRQPIFALGELAAARRFSGSGCTPAVVAIGTVWSHGTGTSVTSPLLNLRTRRPVFEGNWSPAYEDRALNDAEWQTRRADTRCTRGAHHVTGADIIRISRTLILEPWHFTQTAPAAADDPTGIVVDGGRRRVRLSLANAAHGCVFLVRTPSGAGRCGLGDAAPISCRHFSAGADKDAPANGRASKEREQADQDHWREDVARWNVLAAKPDFASGIEDFQRYLLEAEYTRDAGLKWPEDIS